MQNEIDIKLALKAFNVIRQHGDKQGDYYHYQGFKAWTDFDGYTVQISTSKVALTVFFHNKYDVAFQSENELSKFVKQLAQLVKAQS